MIWRMSEGVSGRDTGFHAHTSGLVAEGSNASACPTVRVRGGPADLSDGDQSRGWSWSVVDDGVSPRCHVEEFDGAPGGRIDVGLVVP